MTTQLQLFVYTMVNVEALVSLKIQTQYARDQTPVIVQHVSPMRRWEPMAVNVTQIGVDLIVQPGQELVQTHYVHRVVLIPPLVLSEKLIHALVELLSRTGPMPRFVCAIPSTQV
jgi:hypothetical protein